MTKLLFSSEATIRRDLSELADMQLIKKVPGGAIFIEDDKIENPLHYKEKENFEKKKYIAQIAYGLVPEYSTIFLDSSSTSYIFAKELLKINNLKIMTYNVYTATLLSQNPTIEVFLPPGKINPQIGSISNLDTINYIKQYYADLVFLSCRGFDCYYGASDYMEPEAKIKRCLADQSKKIILLVDSSKLNKQFFFQCMPLNKISIIITDKCLPDDMYKVLEEKNISVLWEL